LLLLLTIQVSAASCPLKIIDIFRRTDQEVVHVVTANHGTFTADAVIVCVPLGVLKAQSILFTPSLSQRRQQAISSLGMGEHNKVVLVFDRHQQAFWPVGHAFITLRPDNLAETDADAAKDVLARRAILFQEMPTCFAEEYPNLGVDKNTFGPILIAYVHCSLASTLETYTENQLMDAFIRHLARYFPKAAQARMTTCTMSHWCQDAFSRGSYTYVPVHGCIEDIHILAQPCDRYGDMDVSPINLATTHSRPRVFWAGEHTSLTQHSYVHGAYQTGQRAAQELITYFQNEPTSI
jgi:monoamine oxidase